MIRGSAARWPSALTNDATLPTARSGTCPHRPAAGPAFPSPFRGDDQSQRTVENRGRETSLRDRGRHRDKSNSSWNLFRVAGAFPLRTSPRRLPAWNAVHNQKRLRLSCGRSLCGLCASVFSTLRWHAPMTLFVKSLISIGLPQRNETQRHRGHGETNARRAPFQIHALVAGTVFASSGAALGAKRALQSQSADDLVAPSSLAERTAALHATTQCRQLRHGWRSVDVFDPARPTRQGPSRQQRLFLRRTVVSSDADCFALPVSAWLPDRPRSGQKRLLTPFAPPMSRAEALTRQLTQQRRKIARRLRTGHDRLAGLRNQEPFLRPDHVRLAIQPG